MLELDRFLSARVGGRLREVLEPRSVEELVAVIGALRQGRRPWRLLGGGSNVVAMDGTFEEPVVVTRHLRRVEERAPRRWYAEAGCNLMSLCYRSARQGLRGLECCVGVPGSLGAAIRINAGGIHGTIQEVVREVTLLTPDQRVVTREVQDGDFAYRRSAFQKDIVLAAELEFTVDSAVRCQERIREVQAHKKATQPLGFPSAGCIFRNPPGDHAGRLIDQAGLKGLRIGGAEVSPMHANYIVNVDHASGDDFVRLIREVQRQVKDHSGVELELEIDLWD